jgi:hypothetical protein
MWIVMEKTSKGKQKKRMTGWVNNQTLDPALYITSNAFNMNWKVNKKGCYYRNGCAISLRYSSKNDLNPF